MFGRLIVFLIIATALFGLLASNWLQDAENRVLTTESRNITVAKGASMRGFADQLVADGLIDEPWSFRFWARNEDMT